MILIIGLGNIGPEYINTRHNTGFMAIDKLKDDHNFPDFKEKNKYFFTKKDDIILAKPTTYMNLSGEAVLALSSIYKIPPENIIVIHDDLDLQTARIKIKQGGGNGGHNGLKSIDKAIGPNYYRIRIGIDHPRNHTPQIEVVNYVLGKFSLTEKEEIDKSIEFLSQNFDDIIQKNFDKIHSNL